jgi:hypothetical protein
MVRRADRIACFAAAVAFATCAAEGALDAVYPDAASRSCFSFAQPCWQLLDFACDRLEVAGEGVVVADERVLDALNCVRVARDSVGIAADLVV